MCLEHSAALNQSKRRSNSFAEEATNPNQRATIQRSIQSDAETLELRLNELPWPLLTAFQRSLRALGVIYLARGHSDSSLSPEGGSHPRYLDVELYERLSQWSRLRFLHALNCSPLSRAASRLSKYLIIKMVNLVNLTALRRNRSDKRHDPSPWSAGANQTTSGEHCITNKPAINYQQRLRKVNPINAIKRARLINLILLAIQLVMLLKMFAEHHLALIEYCPKLCEGTSARPGASRFHVSSALQQRGRSRQINVRPSLASVMMLSKRSNYETMADYLVGTSCEWRSSSTAEASEQAAGQSSVQAAAERVSESIMSAKLSVALGSADNHGHNHDPAHTKAQGRSKLRPTAGRDIYHYLIIVALMDFLSNLNWRHHWNKYRTLGHETKSSGHHFFWLITSIRLLIGSGHSLQLAQAVSLYIVLKSSEPAACLALLACFVNYINQIAILASRLRYLHLCLNCSLSSFIERPQLDVCDHNVHDRGANNLSTSPLISVQDTCGRSGSSLWANRDGRMAGSWLPMPMPHERARHKLWQMAPDIEIGKYLLMSQMVQLKLGLITLFIHLDSRLQSSPNLMLTGDRSSQEVVILIFCIIESLRCMYGQYDRYYTKYTRRSSESDQSSREVV